MEQTQIFGRSAFSRLQLGFYVFGALFLCSALLLPFGMLFHLDFDRFFPILLLILILISIVITSKILGNGTLVISYEKQTKIVTINGKAVDLTEHAVYTNEQLPSSYFDIVKINVINLTSLKIERTNICLKEPDKKKLKKLIEDIMGDSQSFDAKYFPGLYYRVVKHGDYIYSPLIPTLYKDKAKKKEWLKVLKRDWGITSKKDFDETISSLIYQANARNIVHLDHPQLKLMKESWHKAFGDLYGWGYVCTYDDGTQERMISDSAWYLDRAACLVQMYYSFEALSTQEMEKWLEEIEYAYKYCFDSWDKYMLSFVAGRNEWTSGRSYKDDIQTVKKLFDTIDTFERHNTFEQPIAETSCIKLIN